MEQSEQQEQPKRARIDPNITQNEVNKLRREIIDEGINKKNYSSAEEEDSDVDSDDEILMKFIPKKKNGRSEFESVGYAFALNNKMSKMRSELARNEERFRYLQLDHNNITIKLEDRTAQLKEYSKQNKELRTSNETLTKQITALKDQKSFTVNFLMVTNTFFMIWIFIISV